MTRALRLLSPAALLCLRAGLTGPVAAQEGFSFRLDPLVLEDLWTDVDTDSAKFEEYRDLASGFRLRKLHLSGESADGERWLDLRLRNVGRQDARYLFDYGRADSYSLFVDYNKIPHRFGNKGRMLFTETGPGRFQIADPVQGALQGALEEQFAVNPFGITFAFLDTLLAPYLETASEVDLGLRRDRTLARLDFAKSGAVTWQVEVTHENRVGTRPYGASFGFNNVTELPEPIDYDTSGALVSGEWGSQRSGLVFGLRHSAFENNTSTLTWDNPFRAIDATDAAAYLSPSGSSIGGSSTGFADLAPDNKASSFFLSGRTRFGGDWWANGNVSYIQMSQDEPLLPFTLNTAIVGIEHETGATFDPTNPTNLPVRNADTEVDVLSFSGDTGTRLGEDWSLTFRYRYYDYDNQSPRVEFPGYVRFHAVWEEVPRITVPYAYTKQDLGAELAWDVTATTNLALTYNLQSWDRDFREVDSSDEDILKLSLDSRPSRKASILASYELGDRSIDGYLVEAQEASFVEPEGINNQPGLRKYDEAARETDGYNVLVQLFPADPWNLSFGLTGREEDYDESEFGLISDEILQYNFELGYTPSATTNFYLFAHRADREVFQRARQSGSTVSTRPLDDWSVLLDEATDTWGLGWTQRPAEAWQLDLSARWSNADGDADFTATPGGLPLAPPHPPEAVDFANYEDIELLAGELKVGYQVSERFGTALWYRYEDYTIDSFILQGLQNYLPGALLLNASNGDYTANVVGAQLQFAF
jgi:MtrB/PioB family decaheme-associated outer membrane protein